jgi:Cu(I)/Ag(I) efflux system membrane protein CusA/SilA
LNQRFDGLRPGSVDDIRNAVVDAGLRRIRPCLMTTATTILSLLPVMWSSGRGSDVMKPMALPLMGGLLVSLVTLFTVPALFSWIEERRLLRQSAT